jgi:hypothetical protein
MNGDLQAQAADATNACGVCDASLPTSCTCVPDSELRDLIWRLSAALQTADTALDVICARFDGGGAYDDASSVLESVSDALLTTGRTVDVDCG